MIQTSFGDPAGLKVPIEWPITESQLIETAPKGSHVRVWTDAQTSRGGIGVYVPNESWLQAHMPSTHYEINGVEVAIDINILEYIGVTNTRDTNPMSEVGIVRPERCTDETNTRFHRQHRVHSVATKTKIFEPNTCSTHATHDCVAGAFRMSHNGRTRTRNRERRRKRNQLEF